VAFVSKQGGQQHQDTASSGQPIDFDPEDSSIVKVHYDLAAWSFDHRGDLAQALAEAEIPHYWDGEELVVPEAVEAAADAMFDALEKEIGPFPVTLAVDDQAVEYGLDEWSSADRATLTAELVHAEIPHRWNGATVAVAIDAEEDVDGMLDAIEAGELGAEDSGAGEAPDGALSDIFLAAGKLAKDPFDAKSRRALIELDGVIDAKQPPYQMSPRVWADAVSGVAAIVDRISADADGDAVDNVTANDGGDADDADDTAALAASLRDVVRDYV
jgi:hypothetical protein